MRTIRWLGAAAVLLAGAAFPPGDVTSGIPVGGSIGTYSATKRGGADDGVAVGEALCYT